MTAEISRFDIRFDFNKARWKVTKNGSDLEEEYISCNDAINYVQEIDPRTAELLWKKYFFKDPGREVNN